MTNVMPSIEGMLGLLAIPGAMVFGTAGPGSQPGCSDRSILHCPRRPVAQ